MIDRAVILLCLAFAGCGSAKGTDTGEPPGNGEQPSKGRVFLENATEYEVETAYVNRVDTDRPRLIRVFVGPGERQDISAEELPGGTEIEFDLVLILPAELGFRVRRKAPVQIDGDVDLQIELADAEDPFSLLVE